MTAHKFRPTLEALEDRCTPATFSFLAALGGGHSAISLLIDVQVPPTPIAPETVTISRLLPNEVIREFAPIRITPPNSFAPPPPIHDLFPPGAYRGWLRAAGVSGGEFIVPTTSGDGGGTSVNGTIGHSVSSNADTLTLLLQNIMEQRAKAIQTLSNIEQTISNTNSAIVSNLN
jgi:hypothetical protein